MNFKKYGKNPDGGRQLLIEESANFKNGEFRNLVETPMMTGEGGYFRMFMDYFKRSPRTKPDSVIPSRKTDLKTLDPDRDILVWLGHSSYFLQIDGKKMLIDPVLSGRALTVKSFSGTDPYTADDIPVIDYVFITHDHYDHLDYDTMMNLRTRIRKVITGLGTASHLEHWGFSPIHIIEKDWDDGEVLDEGFTVMVTPARHFSGRTFTRNKTLWASFALSTPSKKIYIGGDSGYGPHFGMIGGKYGPFDLAILECGQYDRRWNAIHMMPEQTLKAAQELEAASLFAGHWGKFSLSYHAWDEPAQRIKKLSTEAGIPLLHPVIGEAVDLEEKQDFSEWWKGLN